MSFDKKKEADPMLQEQLRMAQEDHEQNKAQMKQMEQQGQMAEALAPALQALAQAQQEQQMGQIGGQLGGQNPYALASSQMPGQVASGANVSLNTNVGSAALNNTTARPTALASVGGGVADPNPANNESTDVDVFTAAIPTLGNAGLLAMIAGLGLLAVRRLSSR